MRSRGGFLTVTECTWKLLRPVAAGGRVVAGAAGGAAVEVVRGVRVDEAVVGEVAEFFRRLRFVLEIVADRNEPELTRNR